METEKEKKQWYYQRILGELFLIASFTWALLFTMELVKPGIVSNYLSLPHLFLGLLFLGIWYLVIKKDEFVQPQPAKSLSLQERKILIGFSVFLSVILFLATDLSLPLTLLLIFVTVASLWAGTALMNSNKHL